MTESIIARMQSTCDALNYDRSPSFDSTLLNSCRLLILHYLAHSHHHGHTSDDKSIEQIADLIALDPTTNEFTAVMLPLLLEGAVTYEDVSDRISVRLKGT